MSDEDRDFAVTRRVFLIGAGGVIAMSRADVAAAESGGFGNNFGRAFGTVYITDDGGSTSPTASPVIDRLYVEDTSNPRNPHVDCYVDWEASISEGELGSATLAVYDSAGNMEFSWSYSLSGQSASGTGEEKIHKGAGDVYTVELTVYSTHDTDTTGQKTLDTS